MSYYEPEKEDYNFTSSIIGEHDINNKETIEYWEYTPEEKGELLKLSESNEKYPEELKTSLGKKCPEEIYYMGNLSLFKNKAVAVCGSRNASAVGLELAHKCGRLIAENEITLVSGYARGVDMSAHIGALRAGGETIAVLPYGLINFRLNREMRNGFEVERFLAISELPPTCRFSVRNALRRNEILVALSRAVIVVEPGDTGGTWYSAQFASKTGKPLYFMEGMRPDMISRLKSLGGKRIKVKNGKPVLDDYLFKETQGE